MSTCRDKSIIARQLAIFREVSPDLSSRLEKATGVKAYGGKFEDLIFNGTHNGYGKKRTANGLKATSQVVFNNGAPTSGKVGSKL
jgi:catalase